MIAKHIGLLALVGVLVGAGAAAATGTTAAAIGHAADKARQMASDHSIFHRGDKSAGSDADRECAEWKNHGAYVSHVANESRDRDERNETKDDDESAEHAGDHGKNESRDERNESKDRDDERNETKDKDNETDEDQGEHGQAVREAAQSDIGKCGGHDGDKESDEGTETAGDQRGESEKDDRGDAEHGRSSDAREEHPAQGGH